MTALGAFNLGLDPGQRVDPAALVVVERQLLPVPAPGMPHPERWVVSHAQQWALGTPHPDVLAEALTLQDSIGGVLYYDETGIGNVYSDLIKARWRAHNLPHPAPIGVMITSGETEEAYHVSKTRLVHAFEAKFSSGLVVVAEGCPLRDLLQKQLERFAYEIKRSGAATYEAMREKDHDDLVLALMLATRFRRSYPTDPRYIARTDGAVYASLDVSPDPY